jgi:uncharacterized protein with von Willebrand factor type A (vWA) domain
MSNKNWKEYESEEERKRKQLKKLEQEAIKDVEILEDLSKQINLNADNIKDLLDLNDQNNRSDYCIKHDQFDSDIYTDMLFKSPALIKSIDEGTELLSSFTSLHEDSFLALYKSRPKLLKESSMKDFSIINQKLLKNIVRTEDFKKLRLLCKGNILNSSVGSQTVAKRTLELFKKWIEDYNSKKKAGKDTSNTPGQFILNANNMMQHQQNAQKKLNQAKQFSKLSKTTNNGQLKTIYKQQAQQSLIASKDAYQKAKSLNQQLKKQQHLSNNVIKDVVKTYSEALVEVHETDDFISQWGLGGNHGDGVRVTVEAKRKAIERIRKSNKLKRFTKAIGKMKNMALKDFKKKTKEEKVEIEDVKLGNELNHLIPSELINLAIPALSPLFYKNFTEKNLLEYDKTSEESQAKGPIIVCLDESGSMNEPRNTDSSKEVWSKALTVGILEIAQLQKRDFICIKFNGYLGKTFEFKKGEFNTNKLLSMLEEFSGGGTNFRFPLEKSLDLIKTSRYKKADIVFITDGEARLEKDFIKYFNKIKEEKEFSCFGVLIDAGYNSDGSLNSFCDKITKVSDFVKNSSKVGHEVFNFL